MSKAQRPNKKWVTIWIAIYASFILLDIFFPGWFATNIIKYLGILTCVVYVCTKYPRDKMLILALIFTFIADTILVWTSYPVVGVYIFCFAQLMHLLRLTKAKIGYIFTGIAVISLILAIAVALGLEPLFAIVAVYAILLTSNLITAIIRFRKNRSSFVARCTLYGFITFICCDICVALSCAAPYKILPVAVTSVASFLVWFFYYPSQVFLANSSTKSLRK